MNTRPTGQPWRSKASPNIAFRCLMTSGKHAAFTDSEARISRKVGGKFTACDGSLSGVNLELVPDKKIVQSWRGSDWPEGHYSRAVFSLKEVVGGTRLTFTQTG